MEKHPKKHQRHKVAKKTARSSTKKAASIVDTEDVAVVSDQVEETEAFTDTPEHRKQAKAVADLSGIYHLEEDDDIDMTKMDQEENKRRWRLFVGLAFFGVLAIAALVYVMWFRPVPSSGDVTLTMTTDSKVASGDAVTIEVQYRNNKNVPISTGTVELFYPSGFTPQSTSIEPDADSDNKRFTIANVAAGGSGKIRIIGQLVGSPKDEKEFSAQLTYRPENFSQDFQVSGKTTTTITSSTISALLTVPEQVQTNTEFEYTVVVKNNGKTDLQRVQLVMTTPDGYTFVSSDPKTFSEQDTWMFDEFPAGEEKKVTIKAKLDGKSGDTADLKAEIGLAELDNSFNVQTENTKTILLLDPNFDMSVGFPEKLYPGDAVTLTATIKNTTGSTVKNVTPTLELSGSLWAEKTHAFDTVASWENGEEKTFEYKTTVKKSEKAESVELGAKLVIPAVTISGTEVKIDKSVEKKQKVQSRATVSAVGRYFDASLKKIGEGPLPPAVGKTTVYAIDLTMKAGQNPLQKATITATLPETVTWVKAVETSGGYPVVYDTKKRTVTFTATEVAASSTVTGRFFVSVTPVVDQKASLLVLLGEPVFTATDAFTNESLSQNLDRITTDLVADDGAKGKGIVE